MNEETWVYTYPPKESVAMIDLLADQAAEGKVPFALASVLMDMVVEGMDASF